MGRMMEKNKSIKASTVIEVVVASVIFLLIFCLSLEMLTRMNQDDRSTELLQINMDRNEYVVQITSGNYGYGGFRKSFNWGEISVKIQPYRDYKSLRELHFTGVMKNGKKLFDYRFLTKNKTNGYESNHIK